MKSTVISALPLIFSFAAGLPAPVPPPCPGAPAPTPTGNPALPSSTPIPAPPSNDTSGNALTTAITSYTGTIDCSSKDKPDECVNAETAAPFIEKSFTTYQIDNANEQAALVSLMLFESGNFSYNKNHFPAPGTPGQGTRNMQSPAFNDEYAQDVLGADSQEYKDAESKGPAEVLALVNDNEHSFASAAWFLTKKCTPEQRTALQSGSKEGFTAYTEECIGTIDPEGARFALYELIKGKIAPA